MTLFIILMGIFLLNIPFGYWRSNTSRMSIQWLMAIHMPVPLSIGLRLFLMGGSWILLPVFLAAFSAGQYIGGEIRHYLAKHLTLPVSSCLVMDLVRTVSSPSRRKS